MKTVWSVLLALVLSFSVMESAMAAGAPRGDFRKGVISEVLVADHALVFTQADASAPTTLKVADSLALTNVKLNDTVMLTLEDKGGEKVVTNIGTMFIDLVMKSTLYILFVGFVGGLVSGFIGSGGAFVLTPGMMSLGVPGAVAVASNMCHKFPKAMVGAYKRYKYGQVDLKLGLIMAASAMIGVQLGIKLQEFIFKSWGDAGSNLYVSAMFVFVLVTVGGYVFYDALKKGGAEEKVSKLALAIQKINIPPMIHFKTANVRMSLWLTLPVGFATGLLAATIAVGGFIGVPGMIYWVGAPALVASATELVIAFVMGFTGSIQWAMNGLVDLRLTLLILAASLAGVQLGAIGTTYVKDHTIKMVMGTIMLIVAVSRGLAIPQYLTDLGLMSMPGQQLVLLSNLSFIIMTIALLVGAFIILASMWQAKRHEKTAEATSHGTI